MKKSIEEQLLNDIIDKIDRIKSQSIQVAKSDEDTRVLLLTDINDELSDILLNFENDPLAGSFHDMIFNRD